MESSQVMSPCANPEEIELGTFGAGSLVTVGDVERNGRELMLPPALPGDWRVSLARWDGRPAYLTISLVGAQPVTAWRNPGTVQCASGLLAFWGSHATPGPSALKAANEIASTPQRAGLLSNGSWHFGAVIALDGIRGRKPRIYAYNTQLNRDGLVVAARLNFTKEW